MHILYDVTLCITVKDVESTVQDVETKGNPVNSTAFSALHEFILAVTIAFSLLKTVFTNGRDIRIFLTIERNIFINLRFYRKFEDTGCLTLYFT